MGYVRNISQKNRESKSKNALLTFEPIPAGKGEPELFFAFALTNDLNRLSEHIYGSNRHDFLCYILLRSISLSTLHKNEYLQDTH